MGFTYTCCSVYTCNGIVLGILEIFRFTYYLLFDAVCGGLHCSNGGTVTVATCQCVCDQLYTGNLCDTGKEAMFIIEYINF